MIHDIFMPALSSTMTEGKIVEWTKSPGDKVEKGETVLVVESDKADMDVESFNEGYLAVIMVEAGEEAPVGSAIALIAETEAEIDEAKKQAESLKGGASKPQEVAPVAVTAPAAVAATTASTTKASSNGSGRTIASPRAKKLAKQLGVDLKSLQGSGPYGRITAGDVEQASGKAVTAPVATPMTASIASTPTPTITPIATPATAPISVTPGETVPLNTLQKAVVQNMMASLQVPTFHVAYTITTDSLDKLYKQIKPKGVTMTALLAKAIAVTLKNHPVVNASYTADAISYNSEINVAVAVAMPDGGLITPVLRNADSMDIYSLSRSWKDLVNRSRSKQLKPEEYSTGTFTLSNLGMFGVDNFDAILPQGQGSILAVGGSKPQLVADDSGMMGVKRQMKVNITSDHRIIYGAQAAAFLKDLALLIETNAQSLTL
ncbi:2-oxo acid dehydrogenase subunit E2 [Waterburya agarophytonicola K14]|uniref:Dihydrolipoamide acetyltransferase component of pyruvate dehydrogenase complex n=1 Tax=Waterburya agarophytonicola KI4 TaxID=2874699 RepID=A0A964BTK2_9CYAN|nr:dihydrolipoamide acetyltransferase family protein [Waterburya agarophytonicola]MCC0178268.1 2-oxo acid dehydrogenase subunit E2 [Waterburya agarophytonicola KI4]